MNFVLNKIGRKGSLPIKNLLQNWPGQGVQIDSWTNSITNISRASFGSIANIEAWGDAGHYFLISQLNTSGVRETSANNTISISLRYEPIGASSPFNTILRDRIVNVGGGCTRQSFTIVQFEAFPYKLGELYIHSAIITGVSSAFSCAPVGERTHNTGVIFRPVPL